MDCITLEGDLEIIGLEESMHRASQMGSFLNHYEIL